MFYGNNHKVTKYLGYFCEEIYGQEILKIFQSGHTVHIFTRDTCSSSVCSKFTNGVLYYKEERNMSTYLVNFTFTH